LKIAVISQAKQEIRKIKKKIDGSYKDRKENTIARGWGSKKKHKNTRT